MRRQLQDRYLTIRDHDIRYWSAGSCGRAVLLIHGLGTSMEIWKHNVEELVKKSKVYAFDIPEFGHSGKKPVRDDFQSFMAGFIHDFMDAIDLEVASLVGGSSGGTLSIFFALKHPAKVDKIVLVDSAGFGNDLPLILRIAMVPIMGEILTRPSRRSVYRFIRPLVHDPSVLDDNLIDFHHYVRSLPGVQEAFMRILRTFCSLGGTNRDVLLPFMSALGNIKAPTLIVWGRHDRCFPVEHAYYGHERIEDSLLYIVEQSGHLPNLERPYVFNRVVNEFLGTEYH